MSTQWNARMRLSNSGGCHVNQSTKTGAGCLDLTSARATTDWRLLLTSDQISTGLRPGNAFAYASTTSFALSPKPAPKPARCLRRSAAWSSVIDSSDESVQLGDCSFCTELMIIGTSAAVGAPAGSYGCWGKILPSTTGLKPRATPDPPSLPTACCALLAIA